MKKVEHSVGHINDKNLPFSKLCFCEYLPHLELSVLTLKMATKEFWGKDSLRFHEEIYLIF